MEYKLLKTIETNQMNLIPKQPLPRLTPYPSDNCVNPGLGQIARLYSFYVPLYSRSNLHTIKKHEPNVEAVNQEGKGNETDEDLKNENPTFSQNESDLQNDNNLTPLDYNERKRKLMDLGVHESFLHPKLIKTDKIVFSKSHVKTDSKELNKNTEKKPNVKYLKHKFQFE
jgi:hypothetical protein